MGNLSFSIEQLKSIIYDIQKSLVGNIEIDWFRVDILYKIYDYANTENDRHSSKKSKFKELIDLISKIFQETTYKEYIEQKSM